MARLRASRRVGGEVQSDLRKFPSPAFGKTLDEKDYQLVGKLRLPGTVKAQQDLKAVTFTRVPLIVGMNELQNIHQKVMG